MKYFIVCAIILTLAVVARAAEDLEASPSENTELSGSSSSLNPWQEKHQEKRYVGANYAGVGAYGTGLDNVGAYGAGYYNPYQSKLGIDGYAGYPGYNGYTGGYGANGVYGGYGGIGGTSGIGAYTGGYGGYGAYTGGYNSHPYSSSYYNRLSGAYPYARPGYASYPSSYYSSAYGNSIIGGGLGGLGTPGFVPPVAGAAGYQYGPGVSGTIY